MAVVSPTGLLGTRSPILITWNGTGSSPSDIYYFKLEVYAWTGDKDVRPASPIYTIDRQSGFVDVYPTADIAPLLEAEFNNRTTNLDTEDLITMSPDSLLWVEVDYDIEYLSGGFVVNDTGTTTRFLAVYGYSSFVDGSNKLILTVFARNIEPCVERTKNPNEIFLDGYICKEPVYRTTPFGREIADVLLAVNRAYNKSDYIPTIAWGRNSRFCQTLEVGDNIRVWGRLQSREYQKKVSENESIKKIAYEVSISKMEKVNKESEVELEEEKGAV